MSVEASPAAATGSARRVSFWVPLLLMVVLMVAIGAYTESRSSAFLSEYNLNSLLLTSVPLALVAIAQANALLVGGFDVSVGAVMALVVMVGSFILTSSQSIGVALASSAGLIGIGVVVGLANAGLIRVFRLPSIIATLATLSVVQGITLTLRDAPGGEINADLITVLTKSWGFVPIWLIAVVALAVLWDLWLYRTSSGLTTRAVGLDESSSRRLGVPSTWVAVRAFLLSGVMAALAGFFLASQLAAGIPDPGLSSKFALNSIAAAVLGGASLAGGRVSFTGAVFGAVFLSLISLNILPLLGLQSWYELILTGGLTLLALALYQGGELSLRTRSAWHVLRSSREALPADRIQ
jgi:ribose transport system ATP-binding protein